VQHEGAVSEAFAEVKGEIAISFGMKRIFHAGWRRFLPDIDITRQWRSGPD
jgi:hypothetical protein